MRKQQGESSKSPNPDTADRLWPKIWKLQCPPKIKQFLWRVAHNSLAMKTNIKKRKIELDTVCPVCKRFDEDGGHCFLKCKEVRRCWRGLQLEEVRLMLIQAQTSKEFIKEVLNLQTKVRLTVIVLLWRWWDVRNKINAGEKMIDTVAVLRDVAIMTENCRKKEQQTKPAQSSSKRTWCLPGQQRVKINIDGAFLQSTKNGAWGFVIRDEAGKVVLAGAGNMGQAHDALMVEATACLRSLQIANQFGISNIELETDSAQLVQAIKTCSRDLSPSGANFKAIRQILLTCFIVSACNHVPRSCNSSAHEAAQLARIWDPGQEQVWTESIPSCVNDAVIRDVAELSLRNERP